jgi:hypothetical protein
MSLRTKLIIGAFIALGLFIAVPFLDGHKGNLDDLFMNLASEIMGIIFTVAIIDQMLEHERRLDDERRRAWHFLRAIDHAVWIWQGGSRGLNLGELIALLDQIKETDPLPQFTENRFVNIGCEAEANLRELRAFRGVGESLRSGLEALARIVTLHDAKELTANQLAMEVKETVAYLVKAVPIEVSKPRIPPVKNCLEESQRGRFATME